VPSREVLDGEDAREDTTVTISGGSMGCAAAASKLLLARAAALISSRSSNSAADLSPGVGPKRLRLDTSVERRPQSGTGTSETSSDGSWMVPWPGCAGTSPK
jgi:hypothetical protein